MKMIYSLRLLIGIFTLSYAHFCFAQTYTDNEKVVLKYFNEVVNQQDLSKLDEVVARDYKSYMLTDNSKLSSRNIEDLRSFLKKLFHAFPDLHYTIGDVISEDDKVVVRAVLNGTHSAEFMGYPPTNRKINYLSEILFLKIKDGKIQENHVQIDWYNLFNYLDGD